MPYIRNRFIKNAVITSDKLVAGTIVAASLADGILTGAKAATTATTPAGGTTAPALPVVVLLNTADAAGDTTYVLPYKCAVVGVSAQKINAATGAFTNTVVLKNGANAVSSVMSFNNQPRGTVVNTTLIDDTYSTFTAGSNLTLTVVKAGGNAEFSVIVTLVKVA
jgi:hypothetical protein